MLLGKARNLFHLPLAEQACGANLPQPERAPGDYINADCLCQARRLLDPSVDRAKTPFTSALGHDQQRALAARHSTVVSPFEDAQPSSPAAASPPRFNGCPGCMVEMACL